MERSWIGRNRIARSWLFVPPLQGLSAALFSAGAIVTATLMRYLMSISVNDGPCTVFCPFVLATGLFCGWRYAVVVAVASALACNTILMGAPYRFHLQLSEIEGLTTFIVYSLLVIGIVQLFRLTAARSLRQAGAKERASGVVFSVSGGQAWASWYGIDAPVRLGPQEEVAEMMEDFLAQVKLGQRLGEDYAKVRVKAR